MPRMRILRDDEKWRIYVLREIGTSLVRYVGFTTGTLASRLSGHKNSAKNPGKVGRLSHKNYWIKSVIGSGGDIEIIKIEDGIGPDWEVREKHWIAWYRKIMGTKLTNITHGGDGFNGYEYTEEHRASVSRQFKGVAKSPEHIAKTVASRKNREGKPPLKGTKGTRQGKRSLEIVAKMSETMLKFLAENPGGRGFGTGSHHTEKTRVLQSEIAKERYRQSGGMSEESKIKQRVAFHKKSPEEQQDIINRKRTSRAGYRHSDESRAKLAATHSRKRYLQAIPFLYEYAYGEPFPQ